MITDIPIHPRIRFTIELISHLRGIKSVFDTLIITAGLVFTFWLVISVGIKYEVKIKGKEYGFTVGGMNKEEKYQNFINSLYWSNGMWDMDLLFTNKELENVNGKVFEDFIRTMFPLIVKCTAYQYGSVIHIQLTPCEYPYRPSYNYIPLLKLKQEYTVTKVS